MCPFILLTFFFTILMLMAEIATALITVAFNTTANSIQLQEGKSARIQFQLTTNNQQELFDRYKFSVDRPDIVDFEDRYEFQVWPNDSKKVGSNHIYKGTFYIKGKFLGYCRIELQKQRNDSDIYYTNENGLSRNNYQLVSVTRDKDFISKVFIYSVAIVVSISYINMGCALDLDAVYEVLRRPIAPGIGIFSQYILMPLISFTLAMIFFDETYLKLGIFIFGCSPGGGASNMWTVLVNGNLNLSITMTFISTLLSIGCMPFWLYTLGRQIFKGTTTSPPFRNILTTLASMVIFLGIGLLIKKFFPRIANLSRRILAPFSGIMIIFIIVFGTYANFYMFKVMSWQMLLAAAINVWCGMCLGFSLAYLFRKPIEDMLAIAIETGVQNTGVSIVVLGLSLKQPDADLASAVPVAASIMTPIPLTVAWLLIRLQNRFFCKQKNSTAFRSNSFGQYKLEMDESYNNSSRASDSEYSSKINLKF